MAENYEAQSCIRLVPIFKNLSKREEEDVVMISSHQHLDKGSIIFKAGDNLSSLYVVHRGKIKITRYSEDGKEQVIRILGKGEFFGELALFNDDLVSTYAEAIEPTVVCLVDSKKLKTVMKENPTLTFKMMNELSLRLEKAEASLERANLYDAKAKVSRLLLDLSSNNYAKFTTTKVNLASSIGITPETFSRKLKELEEMGLIRIVNNKLIEIKDEYGLKLNVDPQKI